MSDLPQVYLGAEINLVTNAQLQTVINHMNRCLNELVKRIEALENNQKQSGE